MMNTETIRDPRGNPDERSVFSDDPEVLLKELIERGEVDPEMFGLQELSRLLSAAPRFELLEDGKELGFWLPDIRSRIPFAALTEAGPPMLEVARIPTVRPKNAEAAMTILREAIANAVHPTPEALGAASWLIDDALANARQQSARRCELGRVDGHFCIVAEISRSDAPGHD